MGRAPRAVIPAWFRKQAEVTKATGEAAIDFTGRVIERTGEGMESVGESLERTGADMQSEPDTTFVNLGVEYQFLFKDADEAKYIYDDGRFVYAMGMGVKW